LLECRMVDFYCILDCKHILGVHRMREYVLWVRGVVHLLHNRVEEIQLMVCCQIHDRHKE